MEKGRNTRLWLCGCGKGENIDCNRVDDERKKTLDCDWMDDERKKTLNGV